jgi:hypothetical protein
VWDQVSYRFAVTADKDSLALFFYLSQQRRELCLCLVDVDDFHIVFLLPIET